MSEKLTAQEKIDDEESNDAGFVEKNIQQIVDQTQRNLFEMWFDQTIIKGAKRRYYKVPSKILALPCGCTRERGYEGELNNVWRIKKRKNGKYFHQECGSDLF